MKQYLSSLLLLTGISSSVCAGWLLPDYSYPNTQYTENTQSIKVDYIYHYIDQDITLYLSSIEDLIVIGGKRDYNNGYIFEFDKRGYIYITNKYIKLEIASGVKVTILHIK